MKTFIFSFFISLFINKIQSKEVEESIEYIFDMNWNIENVKLSQINSSLLVSKDPKQEQKYLRVIENILTNQECQQLIKMSELKGFHQASINIGGKQKIIEEVRNNDRCIIDDSKIMEEIWKRIFNVCQDEKLLFGPFKNSEYEAVGLNERMRILRYDPGTYFSPHYDGSYTRPSNKNSQNNDEISFITAQFYLNEEFQGGLTRFINDHNESISESIIPKIGTVILFQHDILHEGTEVIKGRKYTLRTDIMYRKRIQPLQTCSNWFEFYVNQFYRMFFV